MTPEMVAFANAVRGVKVALDRADASVGHRLADNASFGAGLKVGDIRQLILATERLLALPGVA